VRSYPSWTLSKKWQKSALRPASHSLRTQIIKETFVNWAEAAACPNRVCWDEAASRRRSCRLLGRSRMMAMRLSGPQDPFPATICTCSSSSRCDGATSPRPGALSKIEMNLLVWSCRRDCENVLSSSPDTGIDVYPLLYCSHNRSDMYRIEVTESRVWRECGEVWVETDLECGTWNSKLLVRNVG